MTQECLGGAEWAGFGLEGRGQWIFRLQAPLASGGVNRQLTCLTGAQSLRKQILQIEHGENVMLLSDLVPHLRSH